MTAYYQEFLLNAGFQPDPWQGAAQAGGSVDVSYLGGGCTGWAAVAPDYQLTWMGSSQLLRIYFEAANAGADTVLIVNDPQGNWVCNDDSYGTSDPTIDFNSPSEGTYDIWVGTYGAGTMIPGTLFITETTGAHP